MKKLAWIVLALLFTTGCDNVLRHTKDRLLGPVEKVASPYRQLLLGTTSQIEED